MCRALSNETIVKGSVCAYIAGKEQADRRIRPKNCGRKRKDDGEKNIFF